MADAVKTSTGQTTMATLHNAPPQPQATNIVPKYHTPHGFKTLQEIREMLASKHLTFGQLGDDVLKLLNATSTVVPKIPLIPAATLPAKTPASIPNLAKPVPPKAPLPLPKSSVAPFTPAPTKPANPFVKKS